MTGRRSGKTRIEKKLMRFLLVGNSIVLLAVSLGLVCYQLESRREARLRELASLCDLVGGQLARPLRGRDAQAAGRVLCGLAALPQVVAAWAETPGGAVLARFVEGGAEAAGSSPWGIGSFTLRVARPVLAGRELLGTVVLVSREQFLPLFLFSAASLLCAALGVAALARLSSRRIRRLICDPIAELSGKMELVSRSQDYLVRVEGWTDDELGLLFDCFNEMLAEISIRDERLALHSEELELEVADRTRELSRVNRQLAESLEEVRRAMQTAQSANLAKSDFLAQMSHEIRTPMYGVLGMTELLQDTELNREQLRFVEAVRRSGEALLSIINNILDFSKIEAGRMELESIPFDLHDLAGETLEMFAEDAARKRLELSLDLGRDLPRRFRGDPGRLRQIMVNLVANAVKFTHAGSVRLAIGMERSPNLIRVSVEDTGIGIGREAQGRIFRRFSQGDRSVSRRYGGSGLGLAIVRQLTELMGGELGVESEPGVGSTFHFTAALESESGEVESWPGRCPPGLLRGKRVLVVSDSPATRQAVLGQLKGWGMPAETVADASSALRRLLEAPFDLALLDRRIAGTDGSELAATIGTLPVGRVTRLVLLTDPDPGEGEPEPVRLPRKELRRPGLYRALVDALGGETVAGPCRLPHSPAVRVLLVEDNPVNQEVGRGLLESLGCAVELAGNGLAAVEAVERTAYDLVFMDCDLPELDGLAATGRIRARERLAASPQKGPGCDHLPIISLTAYAMPGDRLACLAAGADDYLSKPFTRDQLAEVIGRHLRPLPGTVAGGAEPASGPAVRPAPAAATDDPPAEAISLDRMTLALDAIRQLPGNRGMEVLRQVVELYLSSTPNLLAAMREAESGGDPVKLKTAAHSFKSSSANLGAVRLAGVCRELETLGRAGSTEGALPLIRQVEEEYRRVCELLQGGAQC